MTLGYFIFDEKGSIQFVSSKMIAYLGGDRRSASYSSLNDLIREEFDEESSMPFREGSMWCRLNRENGESERVELSIEKLDSNGSSGSASFVAEVIRISGNKEIIEDNSRDTENLNFFATVSHELRAPLNGIIGFSALLENTELGLAQQEILEKLQASNFLLKGLINDILEFSRIRSARVEIVEEVVELKRFVNEIGGLFMERARRKQLEIRIDTQDSIEKSVIMPKLRVTQVLTNLISNAIKFSEKGIIEIGVKSLDTPLGTRLMFTVKDNGPGVPADEVKLIFLPFGQSRVTRDQKSEGSGLGLAISKGLVELMGGALHYEKMPEQGSSFSFDLPLKISSDSSPKAILQEVEPALEVVDTVSKDDRARKRILVVEDNQLNADILAHFLRDYGFQFDIVDNGRKAVDTCDVEEYDLVLMDIMLPEMNGYEATERILSRNSDRPKPQIIGVTAKVFYNDRKRCMDAGMVDVVHKPVDFKLLREVLENRLFGLEKKDDSKNQPTSREVSLNESPKSGIVEARVAEEFLTRMVTPGQNRSEVMGRVLQALSDGLDRIDQAIGDANTEEIQRHAHSLKGNLGLIGAWNMLDLAKGLEGAAEKSGANFRPSHWKKLLDGAYAELVEALESKGLT